MRAPRPTLAARLEVPRCSPVLQGAVEPMQIDVDPQEDPQNAPDVNYVVENPTLVWSPGGASRGGQEGTDTLAGLPTLAVFSSDPGTLGLSRCLLKKGGSPAGDMRPASLPRGRAHGPRHCASCLTLRTGLPWGLTHRALLLYR